MTTFEVDFFFRNALRVSVTHSSLVVCESRVQYGSLAYE